jgi:putative ABC transport system permease protein
MRTMGGSRGLHFFSLILARGSCPSTVIGALVGLILSRLGLMGSQLFRRKELPLQSCPICAYLPGEWLLISVTLGVGILASLLPAIKALRIDISKTLSHA